MDAFHPHFRDGSVSGIFGFLGDAYNHPEFFRRAALILAPGGILVFTLPNHRWAEGASPAARDARGRDDLPHRPPKAGDRPVDHTGGRGAGPDDSRFGI